MSDNKDNALATFESHEIRIVWYNDRWYFSITDILRVLTGSLESRRYWSDLKRELVEEAANKELYEKIVQLSLI